MWMVTVVCHGGVWEGLDCFATVCVDGEVDGAAIQILSGLDGAFGSCSYLFFFFFPRLECIPFFFHFHFIVR